VSNAWGQKKQLATDFEFPGTEMYDKPEILYRSFFASTNHENVQWSEQIFHSIFWLEVSRDFGQFLGRLRGNL
jgi:hypothetical protein